MIKRFSDDGWNDYMYWQNQDRKVLKRINTLIKDIERNGYSGIGKPEPLAGKLSGYWSRRITNKDRLIYRIEGKEIIIAGCRFHYNDH